MQVGVYKDLDIEAYHSTDGLSRSGLMEFKKSPSHYWNAYLNENAPAREATDAMVFGNAFHTMVLEPNTFDQRYAILPEGIDRRTKQGKEDFADFMSKSIGKTVIKGDQLETLRQMQQSVYKHPQAWDLISGALYEHSLFWNDPHTGVKCKTRPDIWHHNMTADLKTISSADERTFQRAMVQHGYHFQAAMNREGIFHNDGKDIKNHTFICVEKEFPFMVAVYILDHTVIDYAHVEFKKLLTSFAECKQNNDWKGYETKTIFLPNWVE